MSSKNHDGLIVTLAIAILVAPAIYVAVNSGNDMGPATDSSDDISIGERDSLYSEILGEDREYLVYLPASYDNETFLPQNYPVLYILDGGAHYHSATGVIQFMSEGINGNRQIPEMIVVAIPNTNRNRDLTPTHTIIGYAGEEVEFLESSGGADNFLSFIKDELIPEIESEYRTMPLRTLVGHSFGGLLVSHALLNTPEIFDAYIAIDPSLWWDDQTLLRQAEEVFAGAHDRRASVYISLANNPDFGDGPEKLMENSGREFADILANAATADFRTTLEYYEAEDHGSVPLLSLYYGLLTVFEGFKIPLDVVAEDPNSISRYYRRLSDRLGIEILPAENYVNNIGYNLFLGALEDPDKAISVFQINVSNYPGSYNVYDSLAEAYWANGDHESAIEYYGKSLELNPDNDNAREMIDEISAADEGATGAPEE